ncbi:nitric oxide reductase NorD protein [Nitrosomonas eutropha]|uniref:nitric oxide reductase activation protein NorD n=1 Tax=Nitrosomonas eutropha TaxID=916 RepID=UPI0008977F36|nr:VWA domain-containing protein [Nitrosomonas eutropha]SDW25167.1 nitric oxide reductase NorD protein [Nitrosomonas eutropha]
MWQWLELEEQIGRLWHRLVGQSESSYPHYPSAAVSLESIHAALRTFFHGMGGDHGLLLTATMLQTVRNRPSWKQRLGHHQEKLPLAVLGPERLLLPAEICLFPEASLNRQLYFWLAAFFAMTGKKTLIRSTNVIATAHATENEVQQASASSGKQSGHFDEISQHCHQSAFSKDDPFQTDLYFLHCAWQTSLAICQRYLGLKKTYQTMCSHLLQTRPPRSLPTQEHIVESIVLALLGQPCTDPAAINLLARIQQPEPDFSDLRADKGYHPFLPVPLWGMIEIDSPSGTTRTLSADEDRVDHSVNQEDRCSRKARRRKFDQSERNDPLLLNRFEKLITWSEMVNVNRPVEDDNEAGAREVADSMEELAVTTHRRRASTVLKFDLDLAPEDTDPASLLAKLTYPEWDYRRKQYHAAHCQVLCRIASETGEQWEPSDGARRQFRRIRRQFEALRPRREILRGQPDGAELDLDALVRAQADQAAHGMGTDRLYLAAREQARDLAVAVLVDVSLSTDSWIGGRRVLDIEKEALVALATGIAACQDCFSIHTFTSRQRHFVQMTTVKDFNEPFSSRTLRCIAALRPGYYTRMGTALRHVSQLLAQRPERHRLILLLTDGKPNDLDHYEGRYGVEDTRQAVIEARRQGLQLFGITIDHEAQAYFPYLFGRGGYAIINRPERLIKIIPALYRQLTG